MNTLPELGAPSPFLEAGQMTEKQSLSRWIQELSVAMFSPRVGRSRGGRSAEKEECSRLEENKKTRQKARILVLVPAFDSNLFLKQDCS